MQKYFNFIMCLLALTFMSGCAEFELGSHVGKKMNGVNQHSKGLYKVGSPYKIGGVKYYPKVDYSYDEKGIASWYGPGFDGKQTANGETFDQNELTAAHKTLPLPSIVRVTNLENGRSLVVRVNDRGPYAHGRLIDLSKKSAQLLGFKNKGVAKVRVQLMEKESRMVAAAAQQGKDTSGVEVAMNEPGYKTKNMAKAIGNKGYPVGNPPVAVHSEGLVQEASYKTSADGMTVPGHIKNGSFYPNPMISEYPVKAQGIFIQTGSFTSREAAMKQASGLSNYGRAQVFPFNKQDGVTYYRVRFPAQNVAEADALLERILATGHKDALIVVD